MKRFCTATNNEHIITEAIECLRLRTPTSGAFAFVDNFDYTAEPVVHTHLYSHGCVCTQEEDTPMPCSLTTGKGLRFWEQIASCKVLLRSPVILHLLEGAAIILRLKLRTGSKVP